MSRFLAFYTIGGILSTPYTITKASRICRDSVPQMEEYQECYLVVGSALLWPVSVPVYMYSDIKRKN